jgi:hypothetical protein
MRYSSSEKDEAVSNTGLIRIQVKHRLRLLSDNSPCYLSGELKIYLKKTGHNSYAGSPVSPYNPGRGRTLSLIYEECRQTSELLLPLGTGAGTLTVRRLLQQPSIPRILKQRDSG